LNLKIFCYGVKSKNFPEVFKSAVKNIRKIKEKREYFSISVFKKIDFGVTLEKKERKYMTFSLVVYI